MGYFKAYLNPFDDEGKYTSFVDVTKYVNKASLGDIQVSLDGSPFQLGVFTFSNLNIKLNNIGGQFSDVDQAQSFFRFKRGESQFKVTWIGGDPPECGIAICGEAGLFEEVDVYKGLLSDESFSSSIKLQDAGATVLGLESIFSSCIVPFGTISAGNLVSTCLYSVLNQAKITNILTVNALNINPGINQTIDSIASLQNKTVKESLEILLNCSNSVLYIKNDVIYVGPRTATVDVKETFYGQASQNGVENIAEIDDLKNGISRVYNFVNWSRGTEAITNADSVSKYGYKKKELNYEIFTNGSKISNILQSISDEFSTPKQEFNLKVPLTYSNLDLVLLDRVIVDYPTVYDTISDKLPLCGLVNWGDFLLPSAHWGLTVDSDERYKIINRKINVKDQTIVYRLRKI